MKRIFLGIDLPLNLKLKIEDLKLKYKLNNLPIKLVEPENSHIAVKFLGELNNGQIQQINNLIKEWIKDIRPFKVVIKNTTVFPNSERPRILALKVLSGELEEIGRQIIFKLEELPFINKENRKYAPHITLGRVKVQLTDLGKEQISNIQFSDNLIVGSFQLIQSKLSVNGPIYTVLKDYKLG